MRRGRAARGHRRPLLHLFHSRARELATARTENGASPPRRPLRSALLRRGRLLLPVGAPTPLVPALFVIGESTADAGTNNYLGTLARTDCEPYGRDLDTRRPTGRFSNGRIPVDYLGTGMRGSLTQQVQQVEDTYEQLALALGEAATADLFKRSLFFVSIGSNDFIHYYLRSVSGVQMRYLLWEFNQLLVNGVRQEIKGFVTTTNACCGLAKYGGLFLCVLPQMACSDASSHVWWDEVHPTDAVNRILADNVWSGEHTKMCYPVDLQEMVKPKQ